MNDESAVRLLIEGEQACFRRLEFANSFVSYDIVPPLFAAKCLESVVGRRSQYRLTGIHVLKPLRFSTVTLETTRGERLGRVLNDVAYVIEASANPPLRSDTRLKDSAFLGLAAMPAVVRQLKVGEPIASEMKSSGTIELGWLPYKRRETDGLTTFCRLTMINGWIDLDRSPEELMLCE